MQANRLFLVVLITFLLSIAIRWVCNLTELYHKKSENISLARNKSQPIHVENRSVCQRSGFFVSDKQCNRVCQRFYYAL